MQKYCALTHHMWDGFWLLANDRAWGRLPPALGERVAARLNEPASGAEDLLGAARNLSAAGVLAATQLVKTGAVYSLGQVVNSQSNRGQRTYSVVVIQPGNEDGQPLFDYKLTVNDDLVIAWQGLGTRIDGLAHVGMAF